MPDKIQSDIPNGSPLLPHLHALAASGTNGMRTSNQWEALLHRVEKFSAFGFENTMLIWAQAPSAVLLSTYAGWRRRGRQVIAGSSGIRLIAPGKGGTETVREGFRVVVARDAADAGTDWEKKVIAIAPDGDRVAVLAHQARASRAGQTPGTRSDHRQRQACAHPPPRRSDRSCPQR